MCQIACEICHQTSTKLFLGDIFLSGNCFHKIFNIWNALKTTKNAGKPTLIELQIDNKLEVNKVIISNHLANMFRDFSSDSKIPSDIINRTLVVNKYLKLPPKVTLESAEVDLLNAEFKQEELRSAIHLCTKITFRGLRRYSVPGLPKPR